MSSPKPYRILLAAIAVVATASCVVGAPVAPPAATPAASPAPAAAVPSPGAGAATTAAARPPAKKGAPALPKEAEDADDTTDGPDTWDDLEWEEEVLDFDWEEEADEDALGYDVSNVDYFGDADEDGDGDLDSHALADVNIDGLGVHQIELDDDDEPLMSDEPDVSRYTDKTTGETLTFVADQEFNSFTIALDDEAELAVEFNPDGTILVDGEEAADADEAAEAIVATEVGANASLHALAFVHGALQRRDADASRGNPSCVIAEGTSREIGGYRLWQDEDAEDEAEDGDGVDEVDEDDEARGTDEGEGAPDDDQAEGEDEGDDEGEDAAAEGDEDGEGDEDQDEEALDPEAADALVAGNELAIDLVARVIALRRRG